MNVWLYEYMISEWLKVVEIDWDWFNEVIEHMKWIQMVFFFQNILS